MSETEMIDWTSYTSPAVEKMLQLLKDESQAPSKVFPIFETFLDKVPDEEGYFLLVQIRLQLTQQVAQEGTALRRLDQIANQGAQSASYLKAMQRLFQYIEKENKKLPVPPKD